MGKMKVLICTVFWHCSRSEDYSKSKPIGRVKDLILKVLQILNIFRHADSTSTSDLCQAATSLTLTAALHHNYLCSALLSIRSPACRVRPGFAHRLIFSLTRAFKFKVENTAICPAVNI